MQRQVRSLAALPLVLLCACADATLPVAPTTSVVQSSASALLDAAPYNLTDELPPAMWAPIGVNDSGWVFAWTTLGSAHVLAWRSLADADTVTVTSQFSLPGRSGVVNGRGDLLDDDAHKLWVFSSSGGASTWTDIDITWPTGWKVDAFTEVSGVNDHATVVGYGWHVSRSVSGRKGTTYFYTPFVWTPGGGAVQLPIPAAPAGCAYTHVRAKSINNAGVIVGYGEQSGSGKANCVTRALVWRDRSAPADTLPRSRSSAGLPRDVKLDELRYQAIRINDAGDIGGSWQAAGASGSLRWVAPLGAGAYGTPEMLTGYYPMPLDMDECGRVLYRSSSLRGVWDRAGTLTALTVPAGYDQPGLESLRKGLAVVKFDIINEVNNEGEVFVWRLDPCPPT